ncbi:hypothetical protein AWN90_20750 [Nocardia terpenica]|uniref:Uncharacterized protein n=1 Tax=Nocardia terpenica TaxID=455432 RepID=A0A164PMF5_9NOCA|nr:hypothetical protein AWN90_20750 [Nocardia terpenica]
MVGYGLTYEHIGMDSLRRKIFGLEEDLDPLVSMLSVSKQRAPDFHIELRLTALAWDCIDSNAAGLFGDSTFIAELHPDRRLPNPDVGTTEPEMSEAASLILHTLSHDLRLRQMCGRGIAICLHSCGQSGR